MENFSIRTITRFVSLFVWFDCSVENLEIIDPFHNALLGTSNKKRSLFQMFKTTKTVGGYLEFASSFFFHWIEITNRDLFVSCEKYCIYVWHFSSLIVIFIVCSSVVCIFHCSFNTLVNLFHTLYVGQD